MSGKEKVITDSIEILPNGRGKVVVISHKHIPRKPKQYKRKHPSFLHFTIKSNPESIRLKSYINDDEIVRHIAYPEARQLSFEERQRMAVSLLVTLLPSTRGKREMNKLVPKVSKLHYHISQDFRHLLDLEFRRYQKWRIRNT